MANAIIDVVSADDLPQIVDLYNQIFRPARSIDSFRRRFQGRHNPLYMLAKVGDEPAGFFLGFETKPDTYYAWFYGVLPQHRRSGLGSQLMEAAQAWAAKQQYESIRLECYNQQRPMLHLAIELGYDIVGMRWDADRNSNLVIFEKLLIAAN